jgi:hypothetical protein
MPSYLLAITSKGEYAMNKAVKSLVAVAACSVLSTLIFAQHAATEGISPSPLVVIANEPAPKLFVEAPLPEPLSRGVALVPYRVEHLRILPLLGADAANVSPRVGHLHVSIDDLPWHWADFSQNADTIVVAGLPPGQHKLTISLAAAADHHVYTTRTVTFSVPDSAPSPH